MDYRKALEMIEEKLEYETDLNKINILKRNKNICLNGLVNWEEILLDEQYEYSNKTEINENLEDSSKPKDKYDEIKEVIENEIFLAGVSINLDKWDNLKNHISKIKRHLKDNLEIEEYISEVKDDFNHSEIFLIKNKETKNASFIQSKEKIKLEDYISYNDLILNNIYLFDKIDETILFNLDLMTSFLKIMEGKYDIALKYKNDAREIILHKIKSLLKESHIRGYSFLINNQELSYLEDIVYK